MDAPIYDTMLRGLKHILAVLLKHSQGSCSKKLKDTHDMHKMAKTLKEFAWTALQNDALDTVMLYRNGWAHGSHTRTSWFKLGEAIPILSQWISVIHCKHQCDIPCAILLCESLKNTCSLLFSFRRVYMVEKDPIVSLQEPVTYIKSDKGVVIATPSTDDASDQENIQSAPDQAGEMEELFPVAKTETKEPIRWDAPDTVATVEKTRWSGTISELIAGDSLLPSGQLIVTSGPHIGLSGSLTNWNTNKGTASITTAGKTISLPLFTQVTV